MPIFKKDDGTILTLLEQLQERYECYEEQREARIKVDIMLAFADRDEDGNAVNVALSKNSRRCLGIARSIGKKDRAMGRGDAEIALDGDWWETHTEEEQLALLDHELYHIVPKRDRDGNFKKDDMRRPLIRMRPHDEEFGWFRVIAARHGSDSQEVQMARTMFEEAGQYYWPEMLGSGAASEAARRFVKSVRKMGKGASVTITTPGGSTTIGGDTPDEASAKAADFITKDAAKHFGK